MPQGALFCHADGRAVGEGDNNAFRQFPAPFVLPAGKACGSFDELVAALLDDWDEGRSLLRDGTLEAFFAALGRTDLAREAREAAGHPLADVGLDQLLRRLPSTVLQPAVLLVTPAAIDLGAVRLRVDHDLEVQLTNTGMGLLHGTARCLSPWLTFADGSDFQRFAFHEECSLSVRARGDRLRASQKALEGEVVLETSAGAQVVQVTAKAPPVPFAIGALAGATTPRQLASKARAHPREAARLFESGAVARWYADNGWDYPVEGEPAAGLAAVQQFFDALGLSKPPRLMLSDTSLAIEAPPGEPVRRTLRLWTPDRRPLYARAHSTRSWLEVRGIDLDGDAAEIHLLIPSVPDWPGETAEALVILHANGRQRLEVPVSLTVPGPRAPNLVPIPPLPPVLRPARRSGWLLPAGAALLALALAVAITAAFWPPAVPQPHLGPAPDELTNREGREPPLAGPTRPPREVALHMPREMPPEAVRRDDPPPSRPGPAPIPRPAPRPAPALRELERRQVEVVFCIDTTGSMGGLLQTAKSKIWSICSQIARGSPTPELKVGLVAYRDLGDEYVTKVVPMSRDLDAVSAELEKLRAGGGGDIPESVNEALFDAVNRFPWSKDPRTMKIIFLVGDAPPHMDYKDDVKYHVTCKEAVKLGILINAIQCGSDPQCRKYWKDIASKGGGEYVAIPQGGGLFEFATPFDADLIRLGHALYDTALPYGPDSTKRAAERALSAARRLKGPKGADRAVFAARARQLVPGDLLDALREGTVRLADIDEREVPDEVRKRKSDQERQAFLDEREAQRRKLREEVLSLEEKRAAAQREALAREGKALSSFDGEVLEILRKQARVFEIKY
jgi:hypothetical protein